MSQICMGKMEYNSKDNPDAVHIGLTATPRKLIESHCTNVSDSEITSNNLKYFGNPVYEYKTCTRRWIFSCL